MISPTARRTEPWAGSPAQGRPVAPGTDVAATPAGTGTAPAASRDGIRVAGRAWRLVYPPVLLLVVLAVAWEAAVRWADIPPQLLPSPVRVATAGWADRAALAEAARISIEDTLLGLGLGIVASFGFALVIAASRPARRAVYPLLVGSQTVPVVALAPLLVLWFGFGLLPKVLLVALYTFFPLVVGLVSGMAATPKEAVDLLRTIGVAEWRVLLTVRLPHALPQFFSGLRIAASYALGTAVIAEFLGAFNGLGIYLLGAKASFRTDLVFAAAVVIVVLTLVLFGIVVLAERLALPWRRHERREP